MKNILLTGSNGFIGTYFKINYNTKYKINTFSFRNDDFDNLKLNNIDTVIHLSALVHQMGGASEDEYERVNVTQTLDLAIKSKESGVKHFIFMSSIKVYGEETDIPYNEQSICLPQDNYGKSKLKAEKELKKLEDNKFIISIIRTPIVYGYGVKANIKSLVSLIRKVPILPFRDIENKRSMIYIGNLCYLIDEIIIQKKRGIFLASDDISNSTKELIYIIAKVLDKKIYLLKIPFFKETLRILKPSFYKRLYCSLEIDNKITKERLNLHNPYSFLDGIELMINDKNQ